MFTPLLSKHPARILCCYVNATSTIQIARIANIPSWYFERVVFPWQRLLFEALPEAQLEVHTSTAPSEILSDKILCKLLRVNEAVNECVTPRPSASTPYYETEALANQSPQPPSFHHSRNATLS